MVTDADEVEPVPIGGLGDRHEVIDGCVVLPGIDERAGQGLDRELNAEHPVAGSGEGGHERVLAMDRT